MVMLSIVDHEPAATPESAEQAQELRQEAAEYEIVLGRAQIASWLFVCVIAIAVCSSLAYLAGKSAAVKKKPAAVSDVRPVVSAAPPEQATPPQFPAVSMVVAPKPDPQPPIKSGQPLFAEPETGKVYI